MNVVHSNQANAGIFGDSDVVFLPSFIKIAAFDPIEENRKKTSFLATAKKNVQ